jgi:hypothetical protein
MIYKTTTLYQGSPDRNHQLWNIVSTERYAGASEMLLHINGFCFSSFGGKCGFICSISVLYPHVLFIITAVITDI